jgi:monothiol glutaredoxin
MTDKPVFQRIKKDISENDVVLYMKGSKTKPLCGFSGMVALILARAGIKDFKDIDVLADPELREGIMDFNKWPTFPQLFVKGDFVGGYDILNDMLKAGTLKSFLISKGIKGILTSENS